jgi:hypothetical protein
MKQNIFKTAALAGALIAGTSSLAVAAPTMRVNVPFSFVVNGQEMASGEYSVSESDSGLVTLLGDKTSVMFLTIPAHPTAGDASALNFVSKKHHAYLTGIHVAGFADREVMLHSVREHAKLTATTE